MLMVMRKVVVVRVMRSGNILKIDPIRFADALDTEPEKKKSFSSFVCTLMEMSPWKVEN